MAWQLVGTPRLSAWAALPRGYGSALDKHADELYVAMLGGVLESSIDALDRFAILTYSALPLERRTSEQLKDTGVTIVTARTLILCVYICSGPLGVKATT